MKNRRHGATAARECATADLVTTTAAVLLDTCAIHELRLARILRSLHGAALHGRSWRWSAVEFNLTLH